MVVAADIVPHAIVHETREEAILHGRICVRVAAEGRVLMMLGYEWLVGEYKGVGRAPCPFVKAVADPGLLVRD